MHWSDSSPGRGSPLDREVKLALDETTPMKIANAMVEENIKKRLGKGQVSRQIFSI